MTFNRTQLANKYFPSVESGYCWMVSREASSGQVVDTLEHKHTGTAAGRALEGGRLIRPLWMLLTLYVMLVV